MNPKELLPLSIKGQVKVFKIEGDKKTLIDTIDNALDPVISKTIVAKLLAGNNTPINRISCYNSSTLLAIAPTNSNIPTYDVVEFNARFDEASFSGVIDEIRLENLAEGKFSSITGLNLTKSPDFQVEIQWTLTINSL